MSNVFFYFLLEFAVHLTPMKRNHLGKNFIKPLMRVNFCFVFLSSMALELRSTYFEFISIHTGNEVEFELLLLNGNANFSATDEEGNTAIILAAEKGKSWLLITSVKS